MKILFILEYYYPHIGGVETLFKSLTEQLVQQGHQITVLTNRYDLSLPKNETINGVKIVRLPFSNRYAFTFLAGFRAIQYAREHDLIHTTSYNAAVPSYLAGKWTGTKMVITFHEVWGALWQELPWMSYFSKMLHAAFERFILKMKFDKFVAVSDCTKHALVSSGLDPDRVMRIYNGLDYDSLDTQLPIESFDKTTFLFYGRAGVSKGIDILLKSIQLLKSKDANVQFILVIPPASEPNVQRVHDIIEEEDLNNYIEIRSSLAWLDLQALIKSVDGVIIPSYSEGFCFAAAETIALGTPIISSGRGALSEVIGGKYLELSALTPQSLTSAITQGMNGEWHEKEATRYELDDSVNQYIQLFEELHSA